MTAGLISTITRFLVTVFLFGAAPPAAHALDPTTGISSYRHEHWGEVDGAPGLIDAMAQTSDGWLWLASRQSGLYRFDGVRFIAYTTIDGSRLQHVGISAMQAGSDNALWIGHGAGGLSVLREHRLQHLLAPDLTASVFAIARARDDSMWAATGRGLFRIQNDKAARIGAASGYPGRGSQYVMADSQGRIWAADDTDLYLLEPGSATFRKVRPVEMNPMLTEEPDGSVWLVLGKRFERLTPAAARAPARPSMGASSYQSGFDQDGNLWSGNCPLGVCVVRPASWREASHFSPLPSTERLDQAWQMTSLKVLSVLIDREGNLWIGTAAGVDRLRDQPAHMIEALTDRGTTHALPHPDGRILVLELQRMNGALALWQIVDGKLVVVDNPLEARTMARAPDGSLVLAGSRGIERQYADTVSRIPLPPVAQAPANSITVRDMTASNDALWVNIAGSGWWCFEQGAWHLFRRRDGDRLTLAVDRRGRLHVGAGRQLSVVSAGHTQQIATGAADIGIIRSIETVDDAVLVSGTRGVALVKERRLHRIGFSAAKQITAISGIAQGAGGTYWLNSAQGLLRVAPDDWARTMNNPQLPLKVELFDALDGYAGGGETLRLRDTAFMADDGKLWLAGERGLAWIEPGKLQPNPISANADILGLVSNGREYRPDRRPDGRPDGAIKLGDGAQDLQIDYAAPSLRLPQRVQFRYRLLGAHRQWIDAGARRSAFYQNLAPGRYTFEVIAMNESGVPGPQAATLAFEVTPHLTQTWWFYTICLAAGLLLMLTLYRIRMRHLATRLEERFEIRASERESIARALHDTFLQSLQGLFLSMHAVVIRLPADNPARGEFGALLDRARSVLVEGRDEVKGLRSEFASGQQLCDMLRRDVALIVPAGCERLQVSGADGIDLLHRHLHHNVHAVLREAVVNALRHTDSAVVVHAAGDPRAFVVTVSDAGPGLGAHRAGRRGHYGLLGMREHAAQIGGRLDIDDIDSGGTRVTLSIPAKLAYINQEKQLRAG